MKKKKILKLTVFFVCIALLAAVSGFIITNNSKNRAVAIVNGQPITVKEFKQRLSAHCAGVYDYFYSKYKINSTSSFWNNSYGGEVPAVTAREKTLEDCIRIKILQILAKENGIIEEMSYDYFLKSLKQENEKRKQDKKAKKPVYGPVEYDESSYFTYTYNNMLNKLKNKLRETEKSLSVSDAEVKEYYERFKDKEFKTEVTVNIQTIAVPYYDRSTGIVNEELKEKAEKTVNEIKIRLENGEKFESLVKEYSEQCIFSESYLDSKKTQETKMGERTKRWEVAKGLMTGQVSEIFEAENAFLLIKCVERSGPEYQAFDEVKGRIKMLRFEQKFNNYVENAIKNAKIEVNNAEINKIKVG